MQNISLDRIEPSQLKNFLRKLCIVSSRHAKEEHPVSDFYPKEKKLSYKSSETIKERELKRRVRQLEEELYKTKEERDKALKENKGKINELNIALLSIKTKINELLQAKKEKKMRMKNFEMKLRKNNKVN